MHLHSSHSLILFTLLAGPGCTTNDGIKEERYLVRGHEERPTAVVSDVPAFDAVQRTCALYTAVRSHAWNGPIAFGQDLDDGMVHWNLCPGGEKVACATVSDVMDGAVAEGIPWPHDVTSLH